MVKEESHTGEKIILTSGNQTTQKQMSFFIVKTLSFVLSDIFY